MGTMPSPWGQQPGHGDSRGLHGQGAPGADPGRWGTVGAGRWAVGRLWQGSTPQLPRAVSVQVSCKAPGATMPSGQTIPATRPGPGASPKATEGSPGSGEAEGFSSSRRGCPQLGVLGRKPTMWTWRMLSLTEPEQPSECQTPRDTSRELGVGAMTPAPAWPLAWCGSPLPGHLGGSGTPMGAAPAPGRARAGGLRAQRRGWGQGWAMQDVFQHSSAAHSTQQRLPVFPFCACYN